MYKNLNLEELNGVLTIKMNRPEALNALNTEMLNELETVIDQASQSKTVRVVVLTGEGKSFVAGADISEMKALDASGGRTFSQLGNRIFRKIECLDQPVICAVNGFALGGGCELAMACDIRIASEKAKFGQPEVGLGITPGFGGTQRLPRIIGVARAKELIYTGRIVRADEAERIGLVNEVVSHDVLLEKVYELASAISKNSTSAVAYSKTAINRGVEVDLETALKAEADLFGLCFAEDDQTEGMDAFLQKRTPSFK